MIPGQTLVDGRFETVRLLGQGGFADVYLAKQRGLDRQVALKVLRHDTADQEVIARFDREAKVLSTLSHPNIATFIAFGIWNGARYTALEYVPGPTLHALLECGALPVERTVQILKQILSALDHAHRYGIIHRDLKPQNIVIDEGTERIRVIDFGLAHMFDASQRLTQEGFALGTVQYMAPEQCLGEAIDARSDLYAVGCIAYQCLTGSLPFEAEDSVAAMLQHVHNPPPVAPALSSIVSTLMSKNPADRFQTAEETLHALRKAKIDEKKPSAKSLHMVLPKAGRAGLTYLVAAMIVLFAGGMASGFLMKKPTTFDFGPRIFTAATDMPLNEIDALIRKRWIEVRKAAPIAERVEDETGILRHQVEQEYKDLVDFAYRRRIKLLGASIGEEFARIPWIDKSRRVQLIIDAAMARNGTVWTSQLKDCDSQAMHLKIIAALEQLPQNEPAVRKELFYRYATIAIEAKDKKQSAEWRNKANRLYSRGQQYLEHPNLPLGLARLNFDAHDFADSAAEYEAAVEASRLHAEESTYLPGLMLELARARYALHDLEEARRASEAAVRMLTEDKTTPGVQPARANAMVQHGQILHDLNRDEDSDAVLSQGIKEFRLLNQGKPSVEEQLALQIMASHCTKRGDKESARKIALTGLRNSTILKDSYLPMWNQVLSANKSASTNYQESTSTAARMKSRS